jgi:hypothetical protein
MMLTGGSESGACDAADPRRKRQRHTVKAPTSTCTTTAATANTPAALVAQVILILFVSQKGDVPDSCCTNMTGTGVGGGPFPVDATLAGHEHCG